MFKKVCPNFRPQSGGSIIGTKVTTIPDGGRELITVVQDELTELHDSDLDPDMFTLQVQLDSNIALTEVKTNLLEAEPSADDIEKIGKVISKSKE